MPILLHIDSSPLDSSISRELTREYTAAWKAKNPTGTVIDRNLSDAPPTPVNQAWVHAAYTPEQVRSPEQKQALALSDTLISELEKADEIVIGVAMHNFSIPSTLKLWIDQVVRVGKTFRYGANGPEGLLKGKKATVLIASGGVYSEGSHAAHLNFVEPYLKAIFGFVGITNVRFVTASGAAQIMSGNIDREVFLKPTIDQVRALAA